MHKIIAYSIPGNNEGSQGNPLAHIPPPTLWYVKYAVLDNLRKQGLLNRRFTEILEICLEGGNIKESWLSLWCLEARVLRWLIYQPPTL